MKLLRFVPLFWLFWLMVLPKTHHEGLWYDEAWSMWAVRGSLAETIDRVAHDVHPPLYFVLLDGWVGVAGESELSARFLSAMLGLLALACTYRLGRRFFDEKTGVMAVALLATHGLFIYYAYETRMYMLLLLLSIISTGLYQRRTHTGWYGVSAVALLYTHYYGSLILLGQGLHALCFNRARLRPLLGAGVLFLPWLPILIHQQTHNPNGPGALRLPFNAETLHWTLRLFSNQSSLNMMYGVLVLSGIGLLWTRKKLLLIWMFLTPVLVLILYHKINAYQVRYMIGILPAFVIFWASLVRRLPLGWGITAAVVMSNIVVYPAIWPLKSEWERYGLQTILAQRQAEEVTFTAMPDFSAETYYDRQFGIRNAHSLTMDDSQKIQPLMEQQTGTLWLMMPYPLHESWITLHTLAQSRGVTYANRMSTLMFYRFEPTGRALTFAFEDVVRYQGGSYTVYDQTLCATIQLAALQPLEGQYSYGLHLVASDYTLMAQQDGGLEYHSTGEHWEIQPCVPLPPGNAYVYFIVYRWQDGKRLAVFEDGIYWGDRLIMGLVE